MQELNHLGPYRLSEKGNTGNTVGSGNTEAAPALTLKANENGLFKSDPFFTHAASNNQNNTSVIYSI